MLLYHVALLEEAGQFPEALSLLDTNAKARAIIDRTAVMERRGTIVSAPKLRDAHWCDFKAGLLTKLGNVEEAEHAWKALIQQNSDCRDYYNGYLSIKGVDLGLWYRILTGRLCSQTPQIRCLRRLVRRPSGSSVPFLHSCQKLPYLVASHWSTQKVCTPPSIMNLFNRSQGMSLGNSLSHICFPD